MDSYARNNSDPVTLHKYLYANANPVMNVDPTGNYSVAECNASMALNPIAQQMYRNLLNKTLQTINSISTASADARRLYSLLQSQDFAGNLLLDQWLKDMIQGTLLNMMIGLACSPFYVTRGIMAGFGMTMWLNQFEADLNSGDQELILYDLMQAGSLLGSFCCKCFTGDTLVRTEEGFTRIDEIKAGDYVLAENVETGEKEYKKVLKVYVKEATKLVHLRTDGTKDEDQTIDTTANHPFYVDGRGWVAAEDVEAGDRLHTEDGACVTVAGKEVEKLKKPVKVYNLEVEDFHTYYVTRDEVLVHNSYKKNGGQKEYEIVWAEDINATQDNIIGTNIPKSFTINGMKVNGNEVWVHGNATKHMGEYVRAANGSVIIENELMISFKETLVSLLSSVKSGRNFFVKNGWEIGINGDTGVVYHALYKGR